MCCEPIRTASGQTQRVVMEVATFPGFSSILLWYQNTSTRLNTDSCTGRAVHSGKNSGWKYEEVADTALFSNGTRCRLFHVVHEDSRGRQDLSSSPFCFSALQDSWTEQRLLALTRLPVRRQVLKTSTHLCFQPSVCNSAIWWALDAQARLILWFRQNFSYQCFKTFIPSSYLQSI